VVCPWFYWFYPWFYLKKVQWGDDFSIYAVNRFINAEDHLFFVSFAKDSDGNWVIMTM
jgi:hypothetical protein